MRCDHCLLEFPVHDAVYGRVGNDQRVFCCNGCHGIYCLIHDEGFEKFYEDRKWRDKGITSAFFETLPDLKLFADCIRDVENAKEADIYIDGVRCASCVWLNEKVLSKTAGVAYARVNYATHMAKIRWDPNAIGFDKILSRIHSIGYTPRPYSESEGLKIRRSEAVDLLIRFGTAAFLSSQLMIYSIALYAGYFQGMDAQIKRLFEIIAFCLTMPIILYSGMPLLRSTFIGLRHLRFNMDALIILGSWSAFIFSIYQMTKGGEVYFDTAAMIITLVLLGRYVEAVAKGKASETIERLRDLSPREARLVTVIEGETERRIIPVSSVKAGDILEVVPGEHIPLDGCVMEGGSEADESLVTGESKPVSKRVGSLVIGGSMNLHGSFMFEVTKTGRETVLAGIIRAVEDAQARKPKIQALADKVVGVFVPAILLTAFATILYHIGQGLSFQQAIMTGISVMVIACPCSLGLATPLAVLICTTAASSRGVLIRGGEVIENMARVGHIIFDKTGTITLGKPALKEIIVVDPSCDKDSVLAIAAAIESRSEHSLAHAVMTASKALPTALRPVLFAPVSEFEAIPGKGLKGIVEDRKVLIGNRSLMSEGGLVFLPDQILEDKIRTFEGAGDTIIFIGWTGNVRALLVVSDVLREEVHEVFRDLTMMKYSLSVVSGDTASTTQAVASCAGIEHIISEASPGEKANVILQLQAKGAGVMMVGDGINDAPALSGALVGVAMGKGTDIAMESADAVLLFGNLKSIPFCMRLARKGFGIIKQNIFWAFFYNVGAVPLAVAGLLHPIVAAAAMAASSLFVVGNSLRAGKVRGR